MLVILPGMAQNSLFQSDNGIYYVKGATENVLKVCSHMLVDGTLRALTLSDKDHIMNGVTDKEDRGMRSEF